MRFPNDGLMVINEEPLKFNLVAVGDCIPMGRTKKYFKTGNIEPVLGETKTLFSSADFVLFNLETPLCVNGAPIPKCGSNFRADPETAEGLKYAGFNIAALANNHILDYGGKGLEETLKALDEAKIFRHGAGNSYEEATKPLKIESNGVEVTFLNYAEGEFSNIELSRAGAAPIDIISNKVAIENAKATSDVVIVSVHAGKEYQNFPSPLVQNLYREYISFGADLVIGHHPHIPQGIECYQNGIIVYSLGDFMFDYLEDPGTCVTFALDIKFNEKGINSIAIHPIIKNKDAKMGFMRGNQREVFIRYINRISEPLDNSFMLEKLYEQGIIRHFETFYIHNLRKNIDTVSSVGRQREFAAKFLYNMFDCPSHREALKTAFRLLYKGELEKDKTIQEYLTNLYHIIEILGRHDSIEPWKQPESLSQKIIRHLRKRLNL